MQTPKSRHPLLERQISQARKATSDELDLSRLLDLVDAAYQRHERALIAALDEPPCATPAPDPVRQGLIDAIGDGVITLDADLNVVGFNRAAEAMFGREREEVIGRGFASLGLTREADLAHFLFEHPGAKATQLDCLRSDGATFAAEVTFGRMGIDGADRTVTLWRDVSAQKTAEEALRRAHDEARAASQAKTDFLATMSHEIRTPLNGVLATAAALSRTELKPLQRQMVEVMLQSGELLTTILSDILDLAKIEAGRLQLEAVAFDPESVLASALELFRSAAKEKGLSLTMRFGDGLRDKAIGDAARLRQVAQNLLSNAVKFTAEGQVELRAWLEDDSGGDLPMLNVEVVDSGVGVPPDARERLFSRFSQADSSTTRRFGGTGLGLALCRELVEAMGGDIGMVPRDGGGSCFWFTTPLRRVVADPSPAELSPPTPDAASLEGLRVLAVDDNAINRFVLRAILQASGCLVEEAENGAEAVAAVAETRFDAILMDIHMPVMDGLDAIRAIRSMPGERALTPILAVTADALPEQIERTRAVGADDHVVKPIRPERLLAALCDARARRRQPVARAG